MEIEYRVQTLEGQVFLFKKQIKLELALNREC